MSVFLYTALDATKSFVKGQVAASSLRKATSNLESQGFLIVNIKRERSTRFDAVNASLSRITRLDKIFFTRHLYTLLDSGVPLDQAVHITASQAKNLKLKAVLMDIYKRVQAGQYLNVALAEHRKYFSDFFINLVKVGERSGKLNDVLLHTLEQQEKDHELITKVRSAMMYPSIIMTAALGIMGFMITFVVPKITDILGEYNVELPASTRFLISLSWFMSHYGIVVLPVGFVVFIVGMRMALSNKKFRLWWHREKLGIPLLGGIVTEFNLARIARAMSSLLKSGMSIDRALQMVATVPNNVYYKTTLAAGIPFIEKGIPLTEVLHAHPRLYPPISVRMIEIGERTGRLDHMLDRLAGFYEKSVSNTLGNLSTIIEPFLLLTVGAIVGFIGISILTPIWKFSETI